jgi:hypothetical protein
MGVDMQIQDVLMGRCGLGGVQWALGGRPVRQALRHGLAALLSDSALLGPCYLRRAKYKPGRKLTGYYDVVLRQPALAGPRRSIAVTWTTDAADQDSPAPALLEMQAEAVRRGLAAPFHRLIGGVPHWSMRVQISPLDPHFPQLVRVSDPPYVRTMLATVYAQAAGDPWPEPAARYAITPIRYRPGQRHVLRYDPQETTGRGETLFAKLYEGVDGAQALRVASWVTDQLAESGSGVTGVRPRGYAAEDAVILYPQVFGTPLSGQLCRPVRELAKHLQRAGQALQTLHSAPVSLEDALAVHSFAAEVKGIARTCEHIQVLLPEVGARISKILECAQDLHSRLPHESPVFAHGDFKADHLWITPTGLTLIDFDTCALADPALDIGKFLADLQWWYAGYDQPGVEAAQEQFLKGYGSGADPARLMRSRIYETLVLVKMTAHRVRLFDAAWSRRTEQLIDRADAILRVPAHALGR